MRWLSLFLACQHLNSGTNLHECENQSRFKVQAVPVFRFHCCKIFSLTPRGYEYPKLKTTGLRHPCSYWNTVGMLSNNGELSCQEAGGRTKCSDESCSWRLIVPQAYETHSTIFCLQEQARLWTVRHIQVDATYNFLDARRQEQKNLKTNGSSLTAVIENHPSVDPFFGRKESEHFLSLEGKVKLSP
jgi:hypothetical protein